MGAEELRNMTNKEMLVLIHERLGTVVKNQERFEGELKMIDKRLDEVEQDTSRLHIRTKFIWGVGLALVIQLGIIIINSFIK